MEPCKLLKVLITLEYDYKIVQNFCGSLKYRRAKRITLAYLVLCSKVMARVRI